MTNRQAVRRWAEANNPSVIVPVSEAFRAFADACKKSAQDDSTGACTSLTAAVRQVQAALDHLAAAPRVPDMTIDLLLAGAIGRWRRALDLLMTEHPHLGEHCSRQHLTSGDWQGLAERAEQSWAKAMDQITSAVVDARPHGTHGRRSQPGLAR